MTLSCVFCGQPIGTDEEVTGRGTATAHARCADAALADDAHWDAIAAATGEQAEDTAEAADSGAGGEAEAPGPSRRRPGCLAFVLLGAGALLLTAGRRLARR